MTTDIKEAFGKRLHRARMMRGISLEDLCKEMGACISRQAICKYEKGLIMPNSSNMIRLSSALGVKPDYFFRDSDVFLENIEFRKRSRLGKKEQASIIEMTRDMLERYIEIEQICGIDSRFHNPIPEIVVGSESDVLFAVSELKKRLDIGDDGIASVVSFLEDHGIKVIEIDSSRQFDGLSGNINGCEDMPIVVSNKSFNVERRRFTSLHELGHFVMNFSDNVNEADIEKLCHLFASEMLISEKVFKSIIGDKRNDISLRELKPIQQRFGISVDALMYKAWKSGIISENRYTYYRRKYGSNESFKKVVDSSVYPETEKSQKFMALVYRALATETISVSKASELLSKPVNKIMETLELV